MALFNSGWITFGSANFCSCSKSIQRQTQACSTSTVPMFQCWKSTRAIENQVIFNIFCIFCILFCIFYAYYNAYFSAYSAYFRDAYCAYSTYCTLHIVHIMHILDEKGLSQGFHSLLLLLLGPPSQGPAVHVPPPTTITTVC